MYCVALLAHVAARLLDMWMEDKVTVIFPRLPLSLASLFLIQMLSVFYFHFYVLLLLLRPPSAVRRTLFGPQRSDLVPRVAGLLQGFPQLRVGD